jgi:hypothetical protein
MRPQENELIAMKEMAEWRIRTNLRREAPQLDSVLFANCARGLRKSDWREVVDHLLTAVVLIAGVSECDALTLSLKQLE